MEVSEILALLEAVRDTGMAEVALVKGDFKLRITRQVEPESAPAPVAWPAPPPGGWPPPAPPVPPAGWAAPPPPTVPATEVPQGPAAPAAAAAPKVRTATINAPMVGTFYRAPAPEAPPFAEVGDMVKPGQTVCIIEAMKLMNELESETSGRVLRFLVENGDPVEYGQPLVELEPV